MEAFDVRPEARADRLEVRDQLAGLEVRAPVERHVLEHVREPLLVVRFVERSGLDRQPQQHALGRATVLADEIFEAVRQRARHDRRIERQCILWIEGARRRGLTRSSRHHDAGDEDGDEQRTREPHLHEVTLTCRHAPSAARRCGGHVLARHHRRAARRPRGCRRRCVDQCTRSMIR